MNPKLRPKKIIILDQKHITKIMPECHKSGTKIGLINKNRSLLRSEKSKLFDMNHISSTLLCETNRRKTE